MENDGTTPNQEPISIRDTIADAVEKHAPEQASEPSLQTETAEAKAQRLRDEQGRFAKAEAAKTAVPAQVQPQEKPRPQRPSSWKKDYWGHFDKLAQGHPLTPEEALQLAEYTAQREQDFAKGVSTYKTEWDKAKPVLEALNPIAPLVKQHGFADTNQWLGSVVQTFNTLSQGNPQQKLGTLFQLAAQYQVPLEEIFEQAEDGRWYLNPQKFQAVQPRQIQQQAPQPDVRKTVQEILAEEKATQQVQSLASDKEKYPQFDQVRETMAGLLRAGLVEDLDGAYKAALNMPQHAELKASLDQARQAAEEAKQREEAANAAKAARAKTVSPRSSTPAHQTKTEKGKGIRSTIEDAFNAKSGRV